jgi:hypothetical protein
VGGSIPIEIHRHFGTVYDEDAIDVGLDTGSIKSSEEDIGDSPPHQTTSHGSDF